MTCRGARAQARAAQAPLNTVDPITFSPAHRLRPPSERFWFGTDGFGRDVYSRTMYGGRISLIIGFRQFLGAWPRPEQP